MTFIPICAIAIVQSQSPYVNEPQEAWCHKRAKSGAVPKQGPTKVPTIDILLPLPFTVHNAAGKGMHSSRKDQIQLVGLKVPDTVASTVNYA